MFFKLKFQTMFSPRETAILKDAFIEALVTAENDIIGAGLPALTSAKSMRNIPLGDDISITVTTDVTLHRVKGADPCSSKPQNFDTIKGTIYGVSLVAPKNPVPTKLEWQQNRVAELESAILKSLAVGEELPKQWIEERNELVAIHTAAYRKNLGI